MLSMVSCSPRHVAWCRLSLTRWAQSGVHGEVMEKAANWLCHTLDAAYLGHSWVGTVARVCSALVLLDQPSQHPIRIPPHPHPNIHLAPLPPLLQIGKVPLIPASPRSSPFFFSSEKFHVPLAANADLLRADESPGRAPALFPAVAERMAGHGSPSSPGREIPTSPCPRIPA